MNNKLSYIGEVSHNFNSPPNLGSPQFCMGNTQESGSASLTNVIRYVEEINNQRTGNYDEVNIESCDPKVLKGQQAKTKQKRKRRPTPVTSPRLQVAKSIKRVRRESSYELTTLADGTVSLKSFLALRVDQLRRLSEDLKLNLPPKIRKKELRLEISSWLNIQGGKNSQVISNIARAQESKDQCHPWSTPKDFQNSSPFSAVTIQNRNPEKGVRIIQMSEVNKAFNECSGININNSITTTSKAANRNKSNVSSDAKVGHVIKSFLKSGKVSADNPIFQVRANTVSRKNYPVIVRMVVKDW